MVPSTVPALPLPGRPPPWPKATPGTGFVARLMTRLIARLALFGFVGLPCHAVRCRQVAHTDVAEKDVFGGKRGQKAGGRRQEAGGRRQRQALEEDS